MRFRVLGTTELITNGSSARIGSERQRRLLAALVMRTPATVPADTLIEAVWGDDSPDNAVSALRTVVTRLRHSLDDQESGSGRSVVARPPGYVLEVREDSIDANRFADLAVLGRRHLADGDVDAARAALDEALGLWHGRPYAEFGDEDWAQAEATRLERLFAAARESSLEARLAAGQSAEVLGEVERLIDEEPFSDGPRALQMRALFASGRQAAALRAFQEYRTTLVEELGLEPGPELAQLEQRILDGDPSLLPPSGKPLRGYRLHEQLATTDRGAVFRATQSALGRDVAIEVVTEEIAADPAFVRSFELQGQALAQIGHAHVVPVHDCWRDPDGAYLVRRLLEGGTLADPEVRERLGAEGLARVRDQIRSALDVAHQAGVVHGPIALDDIQLDAHDTAHLSNFRLGDIAGTVEDDDRSFAALFDELVGPSGRPLSPVTPRVGNPYRGLAAFRASDVDVFFGRTRLVQETLSTLAQHGAAFVVGPSGSGKSSVVRAGVGPALAAGELAGAEKWFVVTMVPGANPFAELEAAVLRVAVHPPAGLLDELRDPGQSLTRTIPRVLPEPGATAVLVVDQFEELFTLTPPEERDLFLEAVAEALRSNDGSLKLLATLRADYYDQPLAHPAIASLVKRTSVPVDAPSGDQLRAAIVEPARIVGVDVEPDLVGRLVADATGHLAGLPLLQYALTRLFEIRDGDVLTLDAYVAMGGLAAAIGARAEEVHDGLDVTQQLVCRRLFGRLVAVDATADTRRRARRAELQAAEDDPGDLDTVADRFVQARLLSTDRDPATREPTLEVAHEALFREWPRLVGWIDEDRDTIAALRHLTTAAESWRTTGEDGELYRGARLLGALDLLGEHGDRLTADERAFVTASQDLAEAEQMARERANRRLRGLLVAAGVLLAVALLAGFLADQQREEASEQRDAANEQRDRADQRAADADLERLTALARSTGAVAPEVAILAALEAHRISPSPETLNALHWALTADPSYHGTIGDTRIGGDITILDDGHRIVTHSIDTIEIWDVETREQVSFPFPGSDGVTNHRELHSTSAGDGTLLIATAPTITTILDAATGQATASIEHATRPLSVAVSPGADKLAIGFDNGDVDVWMITGPPELVARRSSPNPAPSLAWHPDGRRLALGTTGGVVLWDLDAGRDVWTRDGALPPFLGQAVDEVDVVPRLLFSSDGERLIVSGLATTHNVDGIDNETVDSGPARPRNQVSVLATADGGDVRPPIETRQQQHRWLSWLDSDESTVVTSGEDTPVEITSLADGTSRLRLDIPNHEASAALPSLGLLVTESGLGLDLHSIDESNPLVRRVELPPRADEKWRRGGVLYASPDPTGERLLAMVIAETGTSSGVPSGGQIINFLAKEPSWEPYTSTDNADEIFAIPWGNYIWTTSDRASVIRDWSGAAIGPGVVPPAHPNRVTYFTVSPSGDHAMFTVDGQDDYLYELGEDAPRQVAQLDPPDEPYVCCSHPQFSTDGTRYSRLNRRGGTDVFDTRSGKQVDFDHEIEARLFGPDGTWFVAVDESGTVRVHDQQTGAPIGEPMVGHRGPINGYWPTNDARRLATIGFDGTARVWDLETTTQVGRHFEAHTFGQYGWSADGNWLATAVIDDGEAFGHLEMWNFDTDTWPDVACQLAGRNMTPDEWEQFGPRTIERRATCPELPL